MNHVNNVTYIRYAESARIGWARNYALHGNKGEGEREKWMELWTPRGDGLILRRIECDFKFVRLFPFLLQFPNFRYRGPGVYFD